MRAQNEDDANSARLRNAPRSTVDEALEDLELRADGRYGFKVYVANARWSHKTTWFDTRGREVVNPVAMSLRQALHIVEKVRLSGCNNWTALIQCSWPSMMREGDTE